MAAGNTITRGTITSLYTQLADVLPKDSKYNFYHTSTPPTKSDPLFAPAPGDKQQRTYCESQFLTVSVTRPGYGESNEIFVFAIEILIYTTKNLTTIFVSKADSTGYLNLSQSSPSPGPSPIRTITSTFISWLAENRQRPGIRLVVSLFARAQNQYLFPGSVESPGKHVLDDRQLVKWWCKTLDPVLRKESQRTTECSDITGQAHVIVPGFDKHETSSFFPASWRSDPADARKWQYGHPLRDIAPNPTAPPRCLVPHFPDDPKARYLDELDDEIPDHGSSQTLFSPSKKGRGAWKSIKTLEQFWDSMAFRQECSSGRLVGFIWLVFNPADLAVGTPGGSSLDQRSSSPLHIRSQELPLVASISSRQQSTMTSSTKRTRRKKLTGPIIARQPNIKSQISNISWTTRLDTSLYYRWPEESRGQVVLDHVSYLRVHDLLLRLDFANVDAATESTRKWINEVRAIGGKPVGWGKSVAGCFVETVDKEHATTASKSGVQANDLSGMIVRKKRKPETGSATSSEAVTPAPGINLLSSGLIRKKPKTSSD